MTTVLGLMSGTSLDGIDVAVVDLEPAGPVLRGGLRHADTVAWPDDLGSRLAAVLGGASSDVATWCRLHTALGQALGEVAACAMTVVGEVDLVVSHGHTLHHDVVDGAVAGTLQVGQPAAIAEATGCPVVADLRARDVAAGGQGAPLVARVDELLLAGHRDPVAALNLGGIANVTVVAPGADTVAFDVGPGNVLLDLAVSRATDGRESFDRDGRLAARGSVHGELRARLLADDHLARTAPKTTGRERYDAGFLDAAVAGFDLDVEDLLATLVDVVAASVVADLVAHRVTRAWAGGGGVANRALWDALVRRGDAAGIAVAPIDELGLPADAREAIAFAVLGWLTWHGLAGNVSAATGAAGPRVLGSVTPGAGPLCPPAPVEAPERLVMSVVPARAAVPR